MKSKLIFKILSLLMFINISAVETYAQSGRIAGKVTDSKTGETLIGLSVKVKGTTKGAITDIEGRFNISGLATGKYTIDFSYIGYPTKSISDIEVLDNKVTSLDVVMEEATAQKLQEVVIRGSARKETLGALYAQQKNSVSMSSGISADVIRQSPDRNTGEVLKRVSGASVQDNKFIIVRGLSDRYNNAMINNSPLPSTEPDRKTFSFDVIPSNLIDNIIISKTATPDLPGDFAGGSVQVRTKDFPEIRNLQVSYSAGYNSISTFNEFYGNKRSALDFIGFGGAERELPSSFPKNRESFLQQPVESKIALARNLGNTWGINKLSNATPSQSLQFVYGNSFRLKNSDKLGLILSTTYRNSPGISEERRNDYNEIDESGQRLPLFEFSDRYYNFNTSLAVLANLSYIRGNNKFAIKNIFNQNFEDSYLSRNGISDRFSAQQISQQEVTERSLLNSVFEGDHLLNQGNQSRINWNVSFSRITNDQPDLRRLTFVKSADEVDNPNLPFSAAVPNVPSPSAAGRFFSELSENVYGATLNYTLPFKWQGERQTFKVGLLKQYKQRDVSARVLGYYTQTNDFNETQALLSLPQDQLFSDANIAANKLMLDDITNPNNKYNASGDLNAGYAMLTNMFFKKLKATWGLRVENYIENLDSRDNSGRVSINNNYFDLLPSANLAYALTEKANLRMSYGRTVARAQFREIAPFTFYDFVTRNVRQGNVNLKRTTIDNLDLRYELYPTAGQVISLSGFYKFLKNPIETAIVPGSSAASKSMSWINASNAKVYGAEIELRHDLEFINSGSTFFKNLVFSTNAAVVQSDVNFEGVGDIADNRPLQGQSPYLINTSLQYTSPKSGWQANVLYNRIGRRISFVGFGKYVNGVYQASYPDIYDAPRNLIDVQVAKQIIKKKGEIKLSVSNLLDSDAVMYQDSNTSGAYNSSSDHLINSMRFGRTASLSFGYRF